MEGSIELQTAIVSQRHARVPLHLAESVENSSSGSALIYSTYLNEDAIHGYTPHASCAWERLAAHKTSAMFLRLSLRGPHREI
jgi:hypothetical protein